MYSAVPSSSRRRPAFPPLPSDPISDSSLLESEIISHDSSSSDDDAEKAAKRGRMLKHAESYLRGEPLYLHSARLRGPVVRNPWRKVEGQVKRKCGGEGESEGGVRKRLKRWSISSEEPDEREIMPPARVDKGKGILTNRATNTIDDATVETSTAIPLRKRSLTAPNVLGRPRSRSPVSRVRASGNHTAGLDRRNSPTDMSAHTDDSNIAACPFKTPVKKRPEQSPSEALPACSPGTFYRRPKFFPNTTSDPTSAVPSQKSVGTRYSLQDITQACKPTTPHQKNMSTSYSPPHVTRSSSSKSKISSTSPKTLQENTKEQGLVLDTIVVAKPAPPFPDIDLKKKRPKIDFAAKSPYAKSAPERSKPSKGRKKKTSIKEARVDGYPMLETGVHPGGSDNGINRAGNIGEVTIEPEQTHDDVEPQRVLGDLEPGRVHVEPEQTHNNETQRVPGDVESERVLNDWLNRHVAASQGTTVQGSALGNNSIANPLLEKPISTTNPPSTTKTAEATEARAVSPDAPSRLADVVDKLQIIPPPANTTTQSPQPITPPKSDTNSTHQPPKNTKQDQSEPAKTESPLPGTEDQMQSQAASWQNTQYQLLAAQKGFLDALQDSPVVFDQYLSAETPGRDLLRPISFFENDPGGDETPRLENDRGMNYRGMSSPFKTPGLTGRRIKWQSEENTDDRDKFISPFKTTLEEGRESPMGMTFTPFRAFATPESSPKPKGFSSPTFTPTQTDGLTLTVGENVNFGFGLLDDEDEEGQSLGGGFGDSFSPVNFRDPGQQGADNLMQQVMGFWGDEVWNIDDELKKMASDSVSTPGGTASASWTGGKGKGKGSSVKKRGFYSKGS